jgi:hypothetical protein
MKKKCPHCNKETISRTQTFLIGFGFTSRCSNCKSKLRFSGLYHMLHVVFITLLTLFFLVYLTNSYGLVGFILAFIIPVFIDIIASFWIPLSKKKN